MVERANVSSVTVTSKGVFLVLADESLCINRLDFWLPTTIPSERMAKVSELIRQGDLFMWTMILDGTFRIEFQALCSEPERRTRRVGAEPFVLSLPTGSLAIRSASSTIKAMSVVPGVYAGTLQWDLDQEMEHAGIESVEDYPDGEGPDGLVEFWPIG